MTMVNTPGWQKASAALRTEIRWLNGMSWERLGWLLVTACALALQSMHSAIFLDARTDWAMAYGGWVIRYLVMLGPVLVCMTIADNIPVSGAKRIAVLALALVIGAQFQWPIRCMYEPMEETG